MTDPQAVIGAESPARAPHVCPWWVGYFLLCPVRRLFEDPRRLLDPHLASGMQVLDFGSAMGYFSIPAAHAVGREGRVVCLDIEPRALNTVRRRATRAGVADRVETVLVDPLLPWVDGFSGRFDVALAVHVMHEVPDVPAGFAQLARALKAGGRLLLAEPRGHVSKAAFLAELEHAARAGLRPVEAPHIRRGHAALLAKQ